jgi:hypothetical protein
MMRRPPLLEQPPDLGPQATWQLAVNLAVTMGTEPMQAYGVVTPSNPRHS